MKNTRFTVEKSTDKDGTEFYDVVDNHPFFDKNHNWLKEKVVVGFYTVEDTDNSGMNYGLEAAEELAAELEFAWEAV